MAQPYIIVNVAGVDRTANVCQPDAAPPLEWSEALRERKTLGLSFISLDGSWYPARGQHITFEFIADTIPVGSPEGLLFGGYITDVDRHKAGGGSPIIISTVTCVSYEAIMDRRRAAAETYIDQVAGGIFNDIGADSLGGEGFFYETETGPVIPEFKIQEPRPTVRQAWDKLVELASTGADKYYWDVGADKQVRFFKQDTYPAPFSITDGSPYVLGTESEYATVTETNQGIVNRVWVYVGQYLRPVDTENFPGDGSTQLFDLGYPVGAPPQISVNGIDIGDFVGIEGETGKQWYWSLGSSRIRQDDAGVILTGADTLSVTYQGLDRRAVGPFDDAASASAEGVLQGDGTGVYENYLEIDAPMTSTDVESAAQSYLDRFKTATITFRGATFTPGLRSGQELTVNLTSLNINLTMLIQSVTLRDHGAGHFLWTFTAIYGAARDDWKRVFSSQAGSTSVTGVGAGGAGAPSTGEGGGTAPAAPNLDATWLSGVGTWTHNPLRRKIIGDIDTTFGYTGVITPPIDATALRQIHITRISPEGARLPIATVVGPFPQGAPHTFKSDAVDYDFTGVFLEFACENAAGQITPNPYTVEITGAPTGTPPVDLPVEVGVSFFEVPPRHQSEMKGLLLTLGIIPVIQNAVYPCTITIWTSRPARRGEVGRARPGIEWRGWHDVQGPGTIYLGAPGTASEFDVWAPTASDELWTVSFALGKYIGEVPIPQHAVTSTEVLISAPAVPAVNAATGAYIDEIVVGTGNKRGMFGWQNMFAFLPFDDPEFVTARWTTQNGSIGIGGGFTPGGQHDGTEKVMGDLDDPTVLRLEGTNLVTRTNRDALWDVPDYRLEDGTINPNNVFRIRLYVSSRNDQFGTGGTWMLQECWSSGVGDSTAGTADHQDIVLDLNSGRPLGANLATSSADGVSHKIPSLVINLSADQSITIDQLGDIHVNQPALVIQNMSGNLTADRISNLNNILIASFGGNITIDRIDNLGTFAIGNFSGSLPINRLLDLQNFNIELFAGDLSIAKIRDLHEFSLTNFKGNIDVGRVNNITLLLIAQFQGNLHVSRIDSITTLAIGSFQGNLHFTRVDQLTTLRIDQFQGSITIDRISNLASFSISNFTSGTINFTRIDQLGSFHIENFSGQINFFTQAGDSTIPINKLQQLFVQSIQGWDGASINVGGAGLQLIGAGGGIGIFGGGNLIVSPGYVQAGSGYKCGSFFTQVIDATRNAYFADLTFTGNCFPGGEVGINTGTLDFGSGKFLRFTRGILVAQQGF